MRLAPARAGRVAASLLAVAALSSIALGQAGEASGAGGAGVAPDPTPSADTTAGTVVLLHGLGRSHRSMSAMARSLETAGYRVINLGYPSRRHSVRVLVDTLAAELDACCATDPEPVHFVTHSLGGILVRAYGAVYGAGRIGRVVMLSPPNHGSEVVDRLPDGLLTLLAGPAAVELGTDSTSVVRSLPPVELDLGIITGDVSINPLFSRWLPGDDDGQVTVESARLEEADDFLVVPYSHTWIMRRGDVIEQVLAFLATGSFVESSRPETP